MSKKPFNSGFDTLGKIKIAEKTAPPPPPPEKKRDPVDEDDADAFFRAMQGVKTLVSDTRGDRQKPLEPRVRAAKQSDDDALIDLAATIDAEAELVTQEPLRAGWARSLDRKIVKKLRAGDIAYQAQLDLHGLRRDQGERDLEKFLLGALRDKQRCVLVITGRGQHSEDGTPVLKHMVSDALRRGRLVKNVLAYTEAHIKDGGEGAYYVLLRRR